MCQRGRKVSNSYYTAGQLTQVTDGSDNGSANLKYTANCQLNTVLYPNGIEVAYTYDAAGRTTSITHTNVSTGSLVVGYNAQYAADGSILNITESPSGDVTTYQNDAAGNLLDEQRTGQRPYSGAYTYFADNNRKTALVITNGVTVHNGAYSYDNGGRLSQVIDSATNLTEEYTWNADNTLATMPGPSYTREFGYNEEAQLLSISHSGTLAYQYAYGADGNRRWAKDIANNAWTWYPCGVACGAGELVEQGSDLTGTTWTTNAQYLRAGGGCSSMLIRKDLVYFHQAPMSTYDVCTNVTGAIQATRVFDASCVLRYGEGTNETNIALGIKMAGGDELVLKGGTYVVPARFVILNAKPRKRVPVPDKEYCEDEYKMCVQFAYEMYESCLTGWGAGGMVCGAAAGYIGGCVIAAGGDLTCDLPKGVGNRAGVIACIGIGVGAGNYVGKAVGGYPCRSAQMDRVKGCMTKLTACKKSGRWGHGQPHYSN